MNEEYRERFLRSMNSLSTESMETLVKAIEGDSTTDALKVLQDQWRRAKLQPPLSVNNLHMRVDDAEPTLFQMRMRTNATDLYDEHDAKKIIDWLTTLYFKKEEASE